VVVKALNHSGSHIRALDTFKANENWGKRKNEKKKKKLLGKNDLSKKIKNEINEKMK